MDEDRIKELLVTELEKIREIEKNKRRMKFLQKREDSKLNLKNISLVLLGFSALLLLSSFVNNSNITQPSNLLGQKDDGPDF